MGVYCIGVVGERFSNSDGTERQAIIRRLRQGDVVELRHEPDNPYDSEAIGVHTRHGQIGYLARSDEWVRDRFLRGGSIEVCVASAGRGDSGLFGVVLLACTAGEDIADELAIRRIEFP